jgi:hypothetical protein
MTAASSLPRAANSLERGLVVERQDQRALREGARDAGRGGLPEGREARAGGHQEVIGVAVVATLELEHELAPGEAAREPHGAHRGLCARGDEAHALLVRNEALHGLRQQDLALAGRAEGRALGRRARHGVDHGGVRVAEDQGAPGADEVEVGAAVGVLGPRAARAHDHGRRPAHGAEGAHGRADAARQHGLGAREERPRARSGAHSQPPAAASRAW